MRNTYSRLLQVLLLGVLLFAGGGVLNAQLPLTRSYFTSTFTSIIGGPGTMVSTATGDDVGQAGIPIGFTFNYLGTPYTTLDVNTNGGMALGASGLAGSAANANMFLTGTPSAAITAWWDDMTVDVGGGIYYQLAGTVGSQVMTVEWSCLSYYTGSTQRLRFQVKLYEGTNVIEFHYGTVTPGTVSVSESATIGCKSTTGGVGQWLDVVTGSSNTGNYFMQAATDWPTRNYRLTPGAPSPLAAGTYTAGSTGAYPNLSEAIADLNHRGVAGPVVISLTDALYNNAVGGGDNWFPIVVGSVAGTSPVNTVLIQPVTGTSTLNYDGDASGSIANGASSTALGTATEPIFALVGSDYVGVSNLNLTSTPGTSVVDRGIAVINNAATNGAQFNAFNNITVSMNRTLTSTIGIWQNVATTPTSALGANSNNSYTNLNIQSVYAGIYLLGNATFPDLACQIGTLSPTVFNTIGGTTANDIGNGGGTQTYGIRTGNQSGGSIFNNNVKNVGGTGTVDGILVELSQGTTNVHRNNVSLIRNTSTTATTNLCGIRSNIATTAGHSLRVYNNGVSDLRTAYTGVATATKQVKGIFVQAAGGGLVTSNINVDNNSVYLDLTSNANISSVCFEIGTASGPVINCRNNNFVNATGAQVAPAGHWGMRSTSATLTGNTGSISNNNNVFISTVAQGFFGQGNTVDYATLGNWQAAMVGQDAASVSGDPVFVNPAASDLHATAGVTNNSASVIAWVTGDIDNQTRSVTTPDIGYDEYTPTTLDVAAVTLALPTAGACYTANEPVSIRIRNSSINTINFGTNNVQITTNVTGATTATLNFTLNTGSLAPAATVDVPVGTVNMSAAGTYTFNATATTAGDQNLTNDAMTAVNRTFSGGTATANPSSVCFGDSTSLTISGQNGTSFVWEFSTNNGATWTTTGATTSPYRVAPTDTILYRALVCGLIPSAQDTINVIDVTPPVAIGDTICGIDTAYLYATSIQQIRWYDSLTGGSVLYTGNPFVTVPTATTTYYVGAGSAGGTHTTTYAAGNGSSGNAFTVKALTNITITGFDGHTSTTTAGAWEIWYRPNDYLLTPGSQTSNVGWTQLIATPSIPAFGTGQVTPITNALNLQIPAGATYSFQIFRPSGSVAYTNGGALGSLGSSNAALEVYQGHGGTAFAGMTIATRVWNGRIHYTAGCPTARVPVTVVVNTADTIAIAASSNTSCSGDTVSLTASSVNTGYNYTWTPSSTLNTATGSAVNAGPTGSTVYTVQGLDSAGCRMVESVAISYVPKPAVTATVSPDTICAGDSIALTSTTNPLNFQVGTGTIANTSTGYPAPFGNFYWGSRHQMLILASELQAQNIGAGFINAMSFDVTSLNAAVPHDNFEIKLALTTVNSINAFQAPTFTSVFTAPSYLPAVGVVAIPFTSNFYWDGTSNIIVETCHNNAAYADNVSVNQSTTAFSSSVYFYQDAAGVCGNSTVTAAITQRPNMYFWMLGSYSYDWSPNATLATPTAANTVGTANGSTNFIVSVTDTLSGCVGVDTAYVFANPLPVINLGNDGYFCGTDATLDAGNPGSTYIWSTADSTQTIFVNTNGTYSVDVTDSIGCSASDTVAITFTPFPVVNLGADTTTCQGNTVTLDAGIPGSSYNWSTSATTQTIGVTTTGSYSVALTDTFGCSDSDTVNVTFNALPTVTASAATDTICNTNNTPVTLTGSPSGGTFSGTGVTGNQFSAPTAGPGLQTITYSFTDGNGCSNSATVSIFVDVCAGVADGFNSFNVGLYPNPNDGRFTFTVAMNADAEVSYEVADARGVVVLRDNSNQPSGLYKQSVNLNDFAAGVYTLRVTVDGVTAHKRLVVQR